MPLVAVAIVALAGGVVSLFQASRPSRFLGPEVSGVLGGSSGGFSQLDAPVQEPRELAYTGQRPEAAVAVAIQAVFHEGITGGGPWQVLGNDTALSRADSYRIMLQPTEPAYCYVFQIDSTTV